MIFPAKKPLSLLAGCAFLSLLFSCSSETPVQEKKLSPANISAQENDASVSSTASNAGVNVPEGAPSQDSSQGASEVENDKVSHQQPQGFAAKDQAQAVTVLENANQASGSKPTQVASAGKRGKSIQIGGIGSESTTGNQEEAAGGTQTDSPTPQAPEKPGSAEEPAEKPAQMAPDNSNLSAGLVAYYPFNGNANDASGNGINCSVQGATLTKDPFEKSKSAYYFDGTSAYLNCGNSSRFNVNHHTIAAWIQTHGIGGYQRIVGKVKPYVHETIDLGVKDDHLRTNFATGTEVNHELNSSSKLQPWQWYHVAVTYDGNQVVLYINGNADATYPRRGTVRTNRNQLAIGRHGGERDQGGGDDFFLGVIDEMRIYNRALSAAEIQQLSRL